MRGLLWRLLQRCVWLWLLWGERLVVRILGRRRHVGGAPVVLVQDLGVFQMYSLHGGEVGEGLHGLQQLSEEVVVFRLHEDVAHARHHDGDPRAHRTEVRALRFLQKVHSIVQRGVPVVQVSTAFALECQNRHGYRCVQRRWERVIRCAAFLRTCLYH